jgi:predicted restriction endonuclease
MLLKDLQETKARHFRDPRSYVRNDGSEVLYQADWTVRKHDVWERGSGRCEYMVGAERCRSEMQDPHHIVPRSKGRDDRMGNLIGLCRLHHDLFDRRKLQWTPKLKES